MSCLLRGLKWPKTCFKENRVIFQFPDVFKRSPKTGWWPRTGGFTLVYFQHGKTSFCRFPKKPIFVLMRHYFSDIFNEKMYRRKLVPQVCPYFYILAKWSANYGYEFFDFAHNISGLKNIVRYYIYKLFADSWELSQWSTSFLTLGWCIRKEKRQNFKKYAL